MLIRALAHMGTKRYQIVHQKKKKKANVPVSRVFNVRPVKPCHVMVSR